MQNVRIKIIKNVSRAIKTTGMYSSRSNGGKVLDKLFPISLLAILMIATLACPVNAVPVSDNQLSTLKRQAEPDITYDRTANTIEIRGPGTVVSLSSIFSVLSDPALLERSRGTAEWLLKANIVIYEQVRLELHGTAAGGDVNRLKLLSEPDRFVSIESSNGQISIRNTSISSWDTKRGTFDTNYLDGSKRAFISAKNRKAQFTDTRMDVIDSEVSYLGYFEETAYGISWKVISEPGDGDSGVLGKGITGNISGNKFHHNYFGIYLWGAGGMEVKNNEFYDNFYYGFDAHTSTLNTLVEDNYSHDNGGHGIIFAERCTENIVRNNTVVNNKGHGIMLHEQSDNNTIEDNTVTGNDDGIAIFESSNNAVLRNTVGNNSVGVRIYGRNFSSSNNLFENNEISDSRSYGFYIYDLAVNNTIRNNQVVSSVDIGVYFKSVSGNILSDNFIRENGIGVQFDSAGTRPLSEENQVLRNTIENNLNYGIYSYAPVNANSVLENRYSGNLRGDLGSPGITGPGIVEQGFLDTLKLVVLAAIVVVVISSAILVYFRSRQAKTDK